MKLNEQHGELTSAHKSSAEGTSEVDCGRGYPFTDLEDGQNALSIGSWWKTRPGNARRRWPIKVPLAPRYRFEHPASQLHARFVIPMSSRTRQDEDAAT